MRVKKFKERETHRKMKQREKKFHENKIYLPSVTLQIPTCVVFFLYAWFPLRRCIWGWKAKRKKREKFIECTMKIDRVWISNEKWVAFSKNVSMIAWMGGERREIWKFKL